MSMRRLNAIIICAGLTTGGVWLSQSSQKF